MFSDDHDEDRSNQAHRVYGVSEKVSIRENLPRGDRRVPLVWNAMNELAKRIH